MKKRLKLLKKNTMTIVLFVLVVVSVVQAVQLNSLKSKFDGDTLIETKQSSESTNNEGVSVPKNIENLPQMVGGC